MSGVGLSGADIGALIGHVPDAGAILRRLLATCLKSLEHVPSHLFVADPLSGIVTHPRGAIEIAQRCHPFVELGCHFTLSFGFAPHAVFDRGGRQSVAALMLFLSCAIECDLGGLERPSVFAIHVVDSHVAVIIAAAVLIAPCFGTLRKRPEPQGAPSSLISIVKSSPVNDIHSPDP